MSVRERVLTVRLLEKARRLPECAKALGLEITVTKAQAAGGTAKQERWET